MEKHFSLPLYASFAVFFVATVLLGQRLRTHPPTDQFLVPPPEYIEYFHFGFNESMADSFWLRWIQDADNCQTYLAPIQKLETKPIDKEAQVSFYDPRHKVCDGSWAFKMLDAVTKLAPRFKMPYLAGGIALAVLTEDYQGATVIFDRGVAVYPDDWNLLYRASYHFLFDLKDKEKAAKYLTMAGDHGAPTWVKSLASRLYSEIGQLELGIRTLEAYKASETVENKDFAEIDRRLKEMKQKLAEASAKGP